MKNYKAIFLFFCMSFINVAFNQTIVSTEIESSNPVLFDFTGIHCVSCPKAHKAIAVVKAHHPEVLALAFHAGNYAVPNVGERDFRTIKGDSVHDKIAFYDPDYDNYQIVWSYPTLTINNRKVGYSSINDTAQFLQEVEEAMNNEAVVNIGALATLDTATRKLSLKVECYYTSSVSDSNFLFVSFCQNELQSSQAGATEFGDHYVHKEMFRGFISNTWGDPLGIPQEGELIVKNYSLYFPDSIQYVDSQAIELVLRNLEIQVYISGAKEKVIAYDYFGNTYKNSIVFDIYNGVNADINYLNSNWIKDIIDETGIKLYPKPARDFVILSFGDKYMNSHNLSLIIFDTDGRKLKRILIEDLSTKNIQIPLKGLKKGLYLMRIEGEDIRITRKMIIN